MLKQFYITEFSLVQIQFQFQKNFYFKLFSLIKQFSLA